MAYKFCQQIILKETPKTPASKPGFRFIQKLRHLQTRISRGEDLRSLQVQI